MPRKKSQQSLVPVTTDDAAIALAEAVVRLDAALDAVQSRMSELSEAHKAKLAAQAAQAAEAAEAARAQAKAAAKRAPTGRVKQATKSVKPGTGALRLADVPAAPQAGGTRPRLSRPSTRPMRTPTAEMVETVAPAVSVDDVAEQLLKSIEAKVERLEVDAEQAQP